MWLKWLTSHFRHALSTGRMYNAPRQCKRHCGRGFARSSGGWGLGYWCRMTFNNILFFNIVSPHLSVFGASRLHETPFHLLVRLSLCGKAESASFFDF